MEPSIKWQIGSAAVLQAVRDLAEARRDVVLVVRNDFARGDLEVVRGHVSEAHVGRLSGLEAFQLILLFGADASLRVRPLVAPSPRSIHLRGEALVEVGLQFVELVDKLSDQLGAPGTLLRLDAATLADTPAPLPDEVRAFAELITEPMTLVELVAGSDFRPIDTVKVCYRLCELGVFRSVEPTAPAVTEPRALLVQPAVPPPIPSAARIESKKKPRGEPSGEMTTRHRKLAHTSRSRRFSKDSLEEVPFDAVDEAFFAGAVALEEPEIDRFEDLENTATRRKLAKRL